MSALDRIKGLFNYGSKGKIYLNNAEISIENKSFINIECLKNNIDLHIVEGSIILGKLKREKKSKAFKIKLVHKARNGWYFIDKSNSKRFRLSDFDWVSKYNKK